MKTIQINPTKLDNDQLQKIFSDRLGFTWLRGLAGIHQVNDDEMEIRTADQATLQAPTSNYGPYAAHFVAGEATLLSVGRPVSDLTAKTLATIATRDDFPQRWTQQTQFNVDMTQKKALAAINQRGQVARLDKVDGQLIDDLTIGYDCDGTRWVVATNKNGLYSGSLDTFDGEIEMCQCRDHTRHNPMNPVAFSGDKDTNVLYTDAQKGRLMVGSVEGSPQPVMFGDIELEGIALRQSCDQSGRIDCAFALSPKMGVYRVSHVYGDDYDVIPLCSTDTPVWQPVLDLIKSGEKIQGIVGSDALVFNTLSADKADHVIPFAYLGSAAALLLSGWVR